jgi:hypothetical protein
MRHSVTLLAVEDYTNKYKLRVVVRACGLGASSMSHPWHTAATI